MHLDHDQYIVQRACGGLKQEMPEKMNRRDFMKQMILAGSIPLCINSLADCAVNKSRPDILLIMPDQMRGDCLSLAGHPSVITRHFDELAEKGVLFRRAYTTTASCIPARFAILSGLHPQTSGVVGYRAKPFFTPTMPELLGKCGYFTALVGRNMHQVRASGSCGYQKQIQGSTYKAKDEYDNFLRRMAPETGGIRKLVEDLGLSYNHWQAKPWPLADDLHPTNWTVNQSLKIISEVDVDQPLFLTSSFYAPHPPLFPLKKYFNAYMKKELPLPAHGDWVDWESLSPEGDQKGCHVLLSGDTLDRAQAGYFGLIEHLDDEVSILIREFKSRSDKAGRPWVIILTSDHGEMLGDHGYFRKCEPYEGSANIPLIICGSAALGFKPGMRIAQPVCLEDIMPTVLSLAGTKSPERVDGVDLVPLLRGDNQVTRKQLHFEHAPCYSPEQAFHALTDGRFKYIWRPLNGNEQLFDLRNDPKEEHDLSKDENYLTFLKTWRDHLIERLANRPEGFSKDGELIPGRPYRALNMGMLSAGN